MIGVIDIVKASEEMFDNFQTKSLKTKRKIFRKFRTCFEDFEHQIKQFWIRLALK